MIFHTKLPSEEHHWTLVMIGQHWFRQWLGAVRQQAITWTNVDLDPCRHMASIGYKELINNWLWPSDAIWRHRPVSIMAQVIPVYLWAPSHYLSSTSVQFHRKCARYVGKIIIRNYLFKDLRHMSGANDSILLPTYTFLWFDRVKWTKDKAWTRHDKSKPCAGFIG